MYLTNFVDMNHQLYSIIVFNMIKVNTLLFFVSVIFLSACSSVSSFKLVNAERQQHELITPIDFAPTESGLVTEQSKSVFQGAQQEKELNTSTTQLQEVKQFVVEKKMKVVNTFKTTSTKVNKFVAHKKIQPSDNFWLDLIRDFFLFLLVAMIIVGIIAAMIVYGNPTVQLIGKVLAITLIVIGTIVLLFG